MILLFGGTSDSLKIMEELKKNKYQTLLSVATDYGKRFSKAFEPNVVQKRMNLIEMVDFIDKHNIDLIIDASHPFADLVSRNAMQAAIDKNIKYIRYERPSVILPNYVECVKSTEEASQIALSSLTQQGIIYLTTGSKTLKEFIYRIPKDRLCVRVLPTGEVLQECEKLGLEAHQVHAIKGPFSLELNKELYRKVKTEVMITKESGKIGGTDVKIKAAHELGIKVISIGRPILRYPLKFGDIKELIDFLKSGKSGE
ncbi:precorrin-6A reductase [Ignavigranum ruoffiae]|uniref:Cobalt-precorrin 6A reductase n=1 Tax=Ignavigranum ruoffiae TaxID=89093 RepID=A0A1H9CFM9_9LACT|nr:precorrin-6A reductase [Ignavigranum ruoffiae]SEP99827.1 cobalt-precorrin 6A reductase [Ignavigranum ruoffiae]